MDTRTKVALPLGTLLTIGGLLWGGATAWGKIEARIEATDKRFEVIERKVSGMEPYIKNAYDKANQSAVEIEYIKDQIRALWRVRGREHE